MTSVASSKTTAPTHSFVTWYPTCGRSDAIAAALGAPSHLIHYLGFKKPLHAPLKYPAQALVTWRRLASERPAVVLVASPPVIAALVAWTYCALMGARLVIDAHTGAFADPRWRWARPLQRWLCRRALVTLVTGEHLAAEVRRWGGRAHVLATVPVELARVEPAVLGPGPHVLVVNTFSADEPLDEVSEAARRTPDVTFHVTGDLRRADAAVAAAAPENLTLTGWLSDPEYQALLAGVDVVVCLTTRDHTMQHGAYEAMAIGTPLVTSDWPLLRAVFSAGTVHVDNSSGAIAAAVRHALAAHGTLSREMAGLRARQQVAFETAITELARMG